jgi:cytochrome c551/c552
VRRLAPIAVLLLVAAGCGPGTVTTPTPTEVVGKAPTPPTAVKGDAAKGKAVFDANGCGGCHTFTPAGSKGTVGPDLDKLPDFAKTAGQPLDDFVRESIVDPDAYIEKGYAKGIMPGTYGGSLSAQQLADLVAFLSQTQ